MKPRRVVLTIEIETPATLADIRKTNVVCLDDAKSNPILAADVIQIQANVIKPGPAVALEAGP